MFLANQERPHPTSTCHWFRCESIVVVRFPRWCWLYHYSLSLRTHPAVELTEIEFPSFQDRDAAAGEEDTLGDVKGRWWLAVLCWECTVTLRDFYSEISWTWNSRILWKPGRSWFAFQKPWYLYVFGIICIYGSVSRVASPPPPWYGSKTYVLATFSWNPPKHMVFTMFWQARPPKLWYLQRFVILHCILLLL